MVIGQRIEIFPGSELGSEKENMGFWEEGSKHCLAFLFIFVTNDLVGMKSWALLTELYCHD